MDRMHPYPTHITLFLCVCGVVVVMCGLKVNILTKNHLKGKGSLFHCKLSQCTYCIPAFTSSTNTWAVPKQNQRKSQLLASPKMATQSTDSTLKKKNFKDKKGGEGGGKAW